MNPAAGKQAAAARKYVDEREAKRARGISIPEHRVCDQRLHNAEFAGLRTVDGHTLALLRSGDAIMVLPVDAQAARRLRRITPGDTVVMGPDGAIRSTKGRGR